MQPGIFAKTFAETGAVPVLAAVRAAGFHVAQFNMACVGLPSLPDIIPAEIVADIAAASQKTGVALAAVSATYNMIDPDLTLRAAGRRRLEEIIRHARAMGAPLVTLCTGTRDREDQWRHHPGNGSPEAWRDLLEEMSVAVRLAETYGVDLGVEPELANVVNSAQADRRVAIAAPPDRPRSGQSV